jgi:ubiquitin carboxyl-terminal hydrolase L5
LSDIPMIGSDDTRRSTRTKTPSTRSLSARSTPVVRSSQTTPQVTPEQDLEDEDATPSKRVGLRKRNADTRARDEAAAVAEAMKPLTNEERMNWKGWVELESDPVCKLPSHYKYETLTEAT